MAEGAVELGELELQGGDILPSAVLRYRTYGTLNAARDNAIVFNTPFPNRGQELEWFIGPGQALDPAAYFIVVPELFGNGVSTSPSNSRLDPGSYPRVTLYDNVVQQQRLVCEVLGIDRLRMVVGYSLGGQQAYHWAAVYPDRVERLAAICSSARTSLHNCVFLQSLRSALTADPVWDGRCFNGSPTRGLRAMAHAFAAWGLSHDFYRERLFEGVGFATLEDFLGGSEAFFLTRDANDLLAMLDTWSHADISANPIYGGCLGAALKAITCRALIMPGSSDFYFPAEDSRVEVDVMSNAQLLVIPSAWGHRAGSPRQNPVDTAFLNHALSGFLL